MKTCEIKDAFGIDALKFSERPDPPLQHGQVRIRVRAVAETRGVNYLCDSWRD